MSIERIFRGVLIFGFVVVLGLYTVRTVDLVLAFNEGIDSVVNHSDSSYEHYNSGEIQEAVRAVSSLPGVSQVAVVSCSKKLLAGIKTAESEDTENILLYAKDICRVMLPDYGEANVLVDCDIADKIIELSYYMDKDIGKLSVERRFQYLLDSVDMR